MHILEQNRHKFTKNISLFYLDFHKETTFICNHAINFLKIFRELSDKIQKNCLRSLLGLDNEAVIDHFFVSYGNGGPQVFIQTSFYSVGTSELQSSHFALLNSQLAKTA